MAPFLALFMASQNSIMAWAEDKVPTFRFQMLSEPTTLDPAKIDGNEGHFLLSLLNRGLYKFHPNKGLLLEGAKRCERIEPLKLRCFINPNHKFSSGDVVTAADYVRAFHHLIDPKSKAFEAGLLLNLKNARAIFNGKLPLSALGIDALAADRLEFRFEEPDFDFEYKLASPLLSPWKNLPQIQEASAILSTGPYKIKEWKPQSKIIFEANPFYASPSNPKKNSSRPLVEALFISDDVTALALYETGRLDLVRRLPTILIPKYEKMPDFFQTPLARFDYIGFGDGIKESRDLRRALALSVDYEGLKKAFFALGRPGCPSFSEGYMDQQRCLSFDPQGARKAWEKVPLPLREKTHTFYVNSTGGPDLLRGAQWYQAQWKKNLGLKTEIRAMEQASHLQMLQSKPLGIFRKGYSLDRPTCLAAVETFETGHPENYIRLDSAKYNQWIRELRRASKPADQKKLCGKIISFLLDEAHFIPQGRIHFSLLVRPSFKGVLISELNVLDLTDLQFVTEQH